MNFLEKDLETIIWENYEGCYARGLSIREIGQVFGDTRHRQVGLGPYGIADLVNIQFYPNQNLLFIQVIECKKDDVNLATYGQAKRYLTALKEVLRVYLQLSEPDVYVSGEAILIGRRFDSTGDFPFVYNADAECTAFTYDYGLEGLVFTRVPQTWNRGGSLTESAVATFLAAFKSEIPQRLASEGQAQENYRQRVLEHGDPASVLLVTPNGVLVNTDKIGRFNEHGY